MSDKINVSVFLSSRKTDIQQRLRISVTDGCNFNCFFCHNEGQGVVTSSRGTMSPTEIAKIIEVATRCGIKQVKLTGGEPLIYRYKEYDIVDLVATVAKLRESHGLDFELSLITNGYLLSKYARELKRAGLDRITISLATLNQHTFRKFIRRSNNGSVERVVEGVKAAVSVGLKPVKINMVLFHSFVSDQGNITEIPDVIKTCKQLGVDELRLYTLLWHEHFSDFHEYYQYWDSSIFSKINFLDCGANVGDNLLSVLRSFGEQCSSLAYPQARMVISCDGLPVAFETMKVGRFNGVACNGCKYPGMCQEGPYALRVSAHGEIRGCLLCKESINILQAIRSGKSDEELLKMFNDSFSLLPIVDPLSSPR